MTLNLAKDGYKLYIPFLYRLLLRVEKAEARAFYEAEAVNAPWPTRELKRQINSLLFEGIALSRDRDGVLALAKTGHAVQQPSDLVKDPFEPLAAWTREKFQPDVWLCLFRSKGASWASFIKGMDVKDLEKEDVPYVFDRETWKLYRMHASDPETWTQIEDAERAFHIRYNSSVISKDHAGVLADGLVQYAKHIGTLL